MTRDEFNRRFRAYEHGQQWAVAVGALPLLAVYLLVHTRWLKPYLQDHKHLMVALMIVVPLGWLFGVAQGWKRLAPRWLGLDCPACRSTRLAREARSPDDADRCPDCDHPLFEGAPRND